MTDLPPAAPDFGEISITDQPIEETAPLSADPDPQYETLEEWIDDWLAPIALRETGASPAWCRRWFEHPEAAARLSVAWVAWEAAWAAGGEAPSRWWAVDWADHWRALSNPAGTFSGCTTTEHHEVGLPLPRDPIPERYKHI